MANETVQRRPRVLVAKPGLDGHDRGAKVIAHALRDAGFEVVYTGLRSSVAALVAAALQEDVDLIGLSILSGAHLPIAEKLHEELRARNAQDLPIVMGGVIPKQDHARLRELGVAAIFGQEDDLEAVIAKCKELAERRSG
jgi:methylmalonyl-CoA mutase C-terminal domain/subunit